MCPNGLAVESDETQTVSFFEAAAIFGSVCRGTSSEVGSDESKGVGFGGQGLAGPFGLDFGVSPGQKVLDESRESRQALFGGFANTFGVHCAGTSSEIGAGEALKSLESPGDRSRLPDRKLG